MTDDVTIEPMGPEDLDLVLSWAADEGWNPGLADAGAFHAADPGGFFLARVGKLPVAAISVVNHDRENAFLGLYICNPAHRGKGIGFRTWTRAIEHAGDRSIGLDGVPDQQQNYARSGFVPVGSSMRHQGRWPGRQSADVREIRARDIDRLAELDTAANGFARPRFLNAWLSDQPSLRETRVFAPGGTVSGFATWRACGSGTKIGPIIAPSTEGALALIADIAARRPEGPLIVDVPEANATLREALRGAGFEVPFVTARMYRGAVPKGDGTLQAIATMELG